MMIEQESGIPNKIFVEYVHRWQVCDLFCRVFTLYYSAMVEADAYNDIFHGDGALGKYVEGRLACGT